MKVLRYLNARINAPGRARGQQLSERVADGHAEPTARPGPLSDYEHAIKDFHDRVRKRVPGGHAAGSAARARCARAMRRCWRVKENRHRAVTRASDAADYLRSEMWALNHRGTEATEMHGEV